MVHTSLIVLKLYYACFLLLIECRIHLMLFIALKDGELFVYHSKFECVLFIDITLFQRDLLHFSQCLTAVLSTLSCQLVAALSGQYNPERQFISDNSEASTKWLEQLAAIGLLVKFESLLLPDQVGI